MNDETEIVFDKTQGIGRKFDSEVLTCFRQLSAAIERQIDSESDPENRSDLHSVLSSLEDLREDY